MSEFSETAVVRLNKLRELAHLLLQSGNAHEFIVANEAFIQTVIPTDFIRLFDDIIQEGHPMGDVKVMVNKILNVFHLTLRNYSRIAPAPDSFLGLLERNNREMKSRLDAIRPVFKAFVDDVSNDGIRMQLHELFAQLVVFVNHYTIKENLLFPVIESHWPDYRCLQIMWSFHDDIRRNLKAVQTQLENRVVDFELFKRQVGDLFFNMLAIKFREEVILFPYILATIDPKVLNALLHEGSRIGFPYVSALQSETVQTEIGLTNSMVNFSTGMLSVEQVQLIFNHLPVDITFVDEHNKVCYFSSPKKRIFPRTTAIIGREVNNCHPPESVHVVEKIVESFRSGQKNQADFWIRMKGQMILIQYFAVRDTGGEYKGVIEVSQEVSHIQALDGEKRLLDW
ncbi:MAG: DUF438 domain-containing protein [Marinilabiliaceae bacterium]|nr:DUF438 domain-containing protein [Marinilabiliaceae bacterium]